MKKGQECKAGLKDVIIYHQNLPKKQLKSHSHKEAHLFYPLKGDIWINDTKVPPGKMYYLKANEVHKFHSSEIQGERLIVQGNLPIKENGIFPANNLIKELLFHILMDDTQESANTSLTLLKKLIKETKSEPIFDITQLHSLAKDERVLKAIELMDENLHLSLSEISKQIGASTKTLTRLFNSELNLSPKQVQTALRIDKALRLQKTTNMSVTEITYEVGYNSLSAFIKAYKTTTGKLPSGQ